MTGTSRSSIEQRFNVKANSLLAVCLFVGIAGGWLLRGSQNAAVTGSAAPANVTASTKDGCQQGGAAARSHSHERNGRHASGSAAWTS